MHFDTIVRYRKLPTSAFQRSSEFRSLSKWISILFRYERWILIPILIHWRYLNFSLESFQRYRKLEGFSKRISIHWDAISIQGATFQYIKIQKDTLWYIMIHKDTLQYMTKSIWYHIRSMLVVQKICAFVETHFHTTEGVSKFSVQVRISRISLQDFPYSTLSHIFGHFRNFYYVFRFMK